MDLYSCRGCEGRFLSIGEDRPARCPDCDGWLARVWMPEVRRADAGSYSDGPNTYASLDEFARADPARLTSREVDFGVLWRERSSASRSYRAAWIEQTGELYVVQAGEPGDGGGHVEVLGMTDRTGVEAGLRGWQDQCRREGSLAWIRSRARRLPRRRSLSRAAALGATLIALGAPAAVHQAHRSSPNAPSTVAGDTSG
jgi:hypothetical protein